MVNERPKSVQKAKAPSIPVDLRERSPSALWVEAFSTLSLNFGAFSGLFRLLDLSATLPPRMAGGTQNASAEFTSKTRPKQEIRDRCRPLRPLGKTDANWIRTTPKKRTSVKITSAKTGP